MDEDLTRLKENGVSQLEAYLSLVASIVVVWNENGSIRICANFFNRANAALEDNQHPLPMAKYISTILKVGHYFLKLGLSEAYMQIKINPESRDFFTISTRCGLPFGVKTASAIYPHVVDNIYIYI